MFAFESGKIPFNISGNSLCWLTGRFFCSQHTDSAICLKMISIYLSITTVDVVVMFNVIPLTDNNAAHILIYQYAKAIVM